MKYSILSGLLSLCLSLSSSSQRQRALTIGDTLPVQIFNKIYNTTSPDSIQRNLNTQATLLDFWATSCGSCIGLFPKMNHLQARFSNELQILMVNAYNRDTEAKVFAAFKQRYDRTGDKLEIPYILQDSILVKYFPYQTIPQYVWLNNNRKIVAITDQFAVTEQNLQDFISSKEMSLPLKDDSKLFDPAAGDLLRDTFSSEPQIISQSAFLVADPALGFGSSYMNAPGFHGSTYTVLNSTILDFYSGAYPKIFDVPYGYVIVSDAAKPTAYLNDSTLRRVSYSLQTPVISKEEQMACLAADLERSFHLHAKNEMRMSPVWVLSSLPKASKLKASAGPTRVEYRDNSLHKFMHNATMTDFMELFMSLKNEHCLNETNINYKINLEIPSDIYSYSEPQLHTWLESIGFRLEKKKRLMRYAVLTKR